MEKKLKRLSIGLYCGYCFISFLVCYGTFKFIDNSMLFLTTYFQSIIVFGVACATLYGIGHIIGCLERKDKNVEINNTND